MYKSEPMLSIDPKEISVPKLHGYLLSAVAPRPIAFASTVNANGDVNLSPFSFFNVFSANPPIAIFSPARRGRDNTTKHTYENVKEHPEVVINIVNHSIVQQMSLSSTEYAGGVNEFEKAGLTMLKSDLIAPPRVAESPVQLECKVIEVKELGSNGGAGNLVICEVVRIHIKEAFLDNDGKLDTEKLDLVGRMGANWYVRASGNALFEVAKPITTLGIGVDKIPADIRNSNILTGNNLGQLGNVESVPDETAVNEFRLIELSDVFQEFEDNAPKLEVELHKIAKQYLEENNVEAAWKTLLAFNND